MTARRAHAGRGHPRRAASGKPRAVSDPPRAASGTPRAPSTHVRLWAVVRRIPRGRVATYGQVAALAGFARQPRLAGYALHALPSGSDVPWHRVLNARGRVSLPDTEGVAGLQQALLETEGVRFEGGRVDLARFGWKPRAPRLKAAAAGTRSARGPTPRRRRA